MLLENARSCLLVVDVQERLIPAMGEASLVMDNAIVLIRAAWRLEVPIMLSRQDRDRAGDVVGPVHDAAGDAPIFDKMEFSCFANVDIREAIREQGRDQFVLAGLETHVAVLQTAFDLMGEGYQVAVVDDATSSRSQISHDVAMRRMAQRDVNMVTTEMVLFEWLRQSGGEAFKELASLIG